MDPFFDNFVNYISLLTVLQANSSIIFYEYTNSRHTFPAEYLLKKVTIGLQLPNLEKIVKNPNIFICCFWFQLSLYGHPWDILLFAWYMFFFLRLICLNCLFCQEIEFVFFLIGTKLVKPNIKHITGFLKLFGGGA